MQKLLNLLLPVQTAYAHCDIPCGIYDPHLSQVAAHSVIRMTKMIQELNFDTEDQSEIQKTHQQLARLVKVKEEHAELVKHEVRVIWGDYFKPEHIEKFPDLHKLVFEIMKLASKSRQEVSLEISEQLLTKVQEFAKTFWESKGFETKSCDSTFPTAGKIIVPKVS